MRAKLPRAPAFASLHPDKPVFRAASPARDHMIRVAASGFSHVEEMLAGDGEPVGRFFRAQDASGSSVFLKLLDDAELAAVDEVDVLVAVLPDTAPVVKRSGIYRATNGDAGKALVAYPYLASRALAATMADMRRLGEAIAGLHQALRSLPAEPIRARAEARDSRLEKTLQRSGRSGAISRHVPGSAQPLHGDLNPGNVLCDETSGRVVFVDFEDLRHAFGAPLLDLALPLERFCLLQEDDEQACALASALLSGYAAAAEAPLVWVKGDLAKALRVINLKSVALLIERREAGLLNSDAEWHKFEFLLGRIETKSALIDSIERPWLPA